MRGFEETRRETNPRNNKCFWHVEVVFFFIQQTWYFLLCNWNIHYSSGLFAFLRTDGAQWYRSCLHGPNECQAPSIEQCDCQSLHQENKAGHHWLAEGHFRDELLPEDSSLCLNVLSARLNNLNICFYLVGKGKRILIFLSKIISLAEFFWIWCILWKASFVKYNWFFDIFLMLLFLKKFKVG